MDDIIPPSRRSDGRFPPGNAGKPRGATSKVGREIKAQIEAAFMKEVASGDKTKLQAAIEAQVDAAAGGDGPALAFLLDRLIGKPRQAAIDDQADVGRAVKAALREAFAGPHSEFRPSADLIGKADERDDT